MKLSEHQIKEIAELLDSGMVCYIHKETGEIKSIIDPDDIYGDTEFWEEELEELEQNIEKYLKIEKMPPEKSFRIMEDFTAEVSDKDVRARLVYALNRSKPFRNFKYEVSYNESIRQSWFKFKSRKYEEWVKDYLNGK